MQTSIAAPMSTRSPAPDPDAILAAKSARLHYVSDRHAGIVRVKLRNHFRYRDAEGKKISNAEVLGRIKSLAVPPAWVNVWICALANRHIQATGRDARGRKQYQY